MGRVPYCSDWLGRGRYQTTRTTRPNRLRTLRETAHCALRSPIGSGVRAYGAPILRALRADFGHYVPLLCALRARNVPASGGRWYEKPAQDLHGSFVVGG